MKRNLLSWGLAWPFLCQTLSEIPRPGSDCGCDRTGPYVRPAITGAAWNALASPRGTYRVEPFDGANGLVVRKGDQTVLTFGPAGGEIGWGFGPDDRGLVIHTTHHGEPGIPSQHFAWLYDLDQPSRASWQIQTAVSEALSVFSPAGRYLLHVTRDPNGRMHLWTVQVATLTEAWRHDYDAVSRPGEPGQRFGLAGWGFSPDADNASLAYLFNVENGVSLNLVNLPRRRQVINGWRFEGTAEVQFSPCGDLLSLVRYPAQAAEVWLEKTLDGSHVVAGAHVAAFGYLEAQTDFHYAQTGNGAAQLTANTAGLACPEISLDAPSWAAGAKLTATAVRATSLRLIRPTAQSRGGKILEYELRQDSPAEQVLGTLTPNETEYTVQDLLPETEYRFSVRARNEAELWTAEPLTVTVKTAKADAVPTWPVDAALTADQLQETSLHLVWPTAVDDVGVTGYRVFQDGEVLATLDGQKRGCVVGNLVIGKSYEFRVQAGDAHDQWSTDGPRLRIATEDLTPPTWPAGSRLYAKEREKHRLVIEWTPAEDNVGVSFYSLQVVECGVSRVVTITAGNVTNYALACLLPGQHFAFAVEASDEAGNWSTNGPRASVSTPTGASDCPAGLELASVNSAEQPGAGVLALGWEDDGRYWYTADSENPALSADGRFVAFDSISTNLVANDRNSCRLRLHENGFTQTWSADVFVRDRSAGTTERVSLRDGGGETTSSSSRYPDLSADGRYVVFLSWATDLVPRDDNGVADVFIRDRERRETRRLTQSGFGLEGNGPSGAPQISADGTRVVFSSEADNLVSHDTNRVADIFVVEVASRAFTRVSVATDGTQANQGSWGAAISADGRFVAFASDASNLVPGDQNSAADVFVHDRQTGETTRVSRSSTGEEANGHSGRTADSGRAETRPALSADGRFVAFDSMASNLVPDDTNGARDVFVHDRQTGQTTRVSLTSEGLEGPPATALPDPRYAQSWGPDLSGDGRSVAFLSKAALVPEKRTITTDVFLHDRRTGATRRVSACTCGGDLEPDFGGANHVAISDGGQAIAFDSESTNIKPGLVDPNWSADVFVFAPEPGPADQDGDGTPDGEEQGPDGNDPLYDGDGDGVPDYLQDNVTARHTLDGRDYFRTRVLDHSAIARVMPVAAPDLTALPPEVALPFGALSIVAFGAVEPGGGLLVELEFPEGVAFNAYYKHGGLTDSPPPRWYEFMYDGQSGAEIDGNRVILHLVDGGRGDDDLLADGNLIDPGGPALVGASPAPRLEVEPAGVVLAAQADRATATLKNVGGRPLVWAVTDALPAWLRLEARRGELRADEATTLSVMADRTGLRPGVLEHTVRIHSGGGTRELGVEVVVPFALDSHAELVGPCVVLAWRSEPGSAYRVQFTDSLATLDWRDASEIIIPSSVDASWTDCRGGTGGRFYRVVRAE